MRVAGTSWSRTIAIFAGLSAALILLLNACEKDDPSGPILDPGGILVGISDCKQFARLEGSTIGPDRDCVEYSFTDDNVLILRHVNAAFNCCPGTISAGAAIRGDTLTITERESARACHCTCLYDLEYRIPGMRPGTYTVVILEPYTNDGDQPIDFTADMKTYPNGRFSTPRDHYPWTPGPETANRLTYVMTYRGCVATGQCVPSFDYVPGDLDCVEYRGIGGNTLVMDHINSGMSCCPEHISADVTLSNDTIAVVERKAPPGCDCNCTGEVHYEVRNLASGRYAVRFTEPPVFPSTDRIAFEADPADPGLNFSGVYRDEGLWVCGSTYASDTTALAGMRRSILGYIAWHNTCFVGDVCRFIGLGVTPCGGPREYAVYSIAPRDEEDMIDVLFLRAWVCRYNEHEYALNRRYGLTSPCPMPAVPQPGCVAGICADLKGP